MNADVTTIVISDPALLAKIAAATGRIVFEGPNGNFIQTVDTVPTARPARKIPCPFTDEQLAEFSKNRTGRPLEDILRDLKAKYGE